MAKFKELSNAYFTFSIGFPIPCHEGQGCVGLGERTVQFPFHRHVLSDFTSDDQRHSHPSKGLGAHELCHQCTGCSITVCWVQRWESGGVQNTSVPDMGHNAATSSPALWACRRTALATLHVALWLHLENFYDVSYCHGVTLHCVATGAQGYLPPRASPVQTCPNGALLHRRKSLNQAPDAATSGPNVQAQPRCTGYQNAPCNQKLSPCHVNMMNAEHFARYRTHKYLVTKLCLLADSFQASLRLISDFIRIKHGSGIKQGCHFKQSPAALLKPATTLGRAILPKQHRRFLRGFSSPSSPASCIQKFPFLSFSPVTPDSLWSLAAPMQNRWFSFLSRRLSEKLHLPQSPKLCHSESKCLR